MVFDCDNPLLFFQGHQSLPPAAPALAPRPPAARPSGLADNQRGQQQQQVDPRNSGSNGAPTCRHTQQQQQALTSCSPLKVSMNPNAPPAESDSTEEEEDEKQQQQQQRFRHQQQQQHNSEMRPYIKPPFHRHISDQAHRPPPSALIQVSQSHRLETQRIRFVQFGNGKRKGLRFYVMNRLKQKKILTFLDNI